MSVLAQISGSMEDKLSWVIPLVLLFGWRLYMFTIRPILNKEDVPYFPYWIPFLGHAVSFWKNTDGVFQQALNHFGHSHAPYLLRVAGKDIAIITSPAQVAQVYRDTKSYDFDPFIDKCYRFVGQVSESGKALLWRSVDDGFQSLFPNPKKHVLAHMGVSLVHKHLVQAKPMREVVELGIDGIERFTHWNSFHTKSILSSVSYSDASKVVSLNSWTRDIIVEAQTAAWFGPLLYEIEPDFTSIFGAWDLNSWMATYEYPRRLATAAYQPRDSLHRALTRYLDSPREIRTASIPLINELEDECINAGLSSKDTAGVLLIVIWGLNTNVPTISFWMLAHILESDGLANALREEISPAMQILEDCKSSADRFDVFKKHILERCDLLRATFHEVMRFTSTGSTVREVKQEAQLGGRRLRKGVTVLMPHRQLLLSTEEFGQDAAIFDPYRFLRDKNLHRNGSYHPFGGGETLCSGRFIARYETYAFVAYVLWRYDMRVLRPKEQELGVKGKAFPRLDLSKPSTGIGKPVEGDDVIIRLTPRCTSKAMTAKSF